ncbi:MAG: ribulose-phosphate 3-epimerase, partial [Anaerolineales bacterium]
MVQPVLHMVDLVLVMTVNPGFGGQRFISEMLTKIAEIRRMLDAIHSPAWLEVDGGINAETLASAQQAGATAFVAGNAVFHHPGGPAAGIASLRQLMVQ